MEQQPGVGASPQVTDEEKLWALLSWIFAPIVPLILFLLEDKKRQPFIKYNMIQALVFSIVGYILSSILAPVFFIGCLVGLGVFGYTIYLAVQSYQGVWVVIPGLTDFCKNQGWI